MSNKKSPMLTCFLSWLITATSCAPLKVVNTAGSPATNPPDACYNRLNRYAWGLWNDAYGIDCGRDGIYEVHTKTKAWEALVAVGSLGIYCPIDIAIICETTKPPTPCPPCPPAAR